MNRCQRLLSIYDALISEGARQGMSAGDCWATVLGVDGQKGTEREGPLARSMLAFQDEIDALGVQLKAAGIPAENYTSQLERLRRSAAPSTMSREWKDMVGNVNPPEIRLTLQWVCSSLREGEGEGEIAPEQLAALVATLEDLEGEFATAGLPPTMSDYASQQLRNLREALRLYRIKGLAPMKAAVEQAFGTAVAAGEVMAAEDRAADPKARTYMQRVGAMITRVVMVCKDVDTIYKGGDAMVSMAQKLQIAFEVFGKSG